MIRSLRILAAVLVLTALAPTILGRPNLICVESAGRTSYGCNDLVPDEVSARLALPVSLEVCSQDCGFCHDYTIGQAVTQSFQTLALPVALVGVHRLVFAQRASMLQALSFPVPVVDSSGSISPLKC
jgi:hypothetical protein